MICKCVAKICDRNICVKLRSGAWFMNVKPLFSYNFQYVIVACASEVRVFGIKSGECVQTLRYHSRPIISIRENKINNLQIFSCSDDGCVVRWDYMDGKVLQVYYLQMQVVSFYPLKPSGPWLISKQFEDHYRLYLVKPKDKGVSNVELVLKPVLPKENTLDYGFMDKFVASVVGNTLTIYKFDSKSIIRHKTGERLLKCVSCHPSDFIIATGDNHGRIVLWSNAFTSNHPIRSIYHWHTLPVSDLAFSHEGSYLHSGGGEAALVKWNLFSEERRILPRMGAPILTLNVSKNNYVVTLHSDNVLQVVDSQYNVMQVIQGLTKSPPQSQDIGLLYDSHLKTLIMNGKPGHLQFYDIKKDKQLFNLDIAGKNFLSQEREITVVNIDVQKAAVDETGLWLATAEYWCNNDSSPQIWLKFWFFDLQKQTFVLNTNVILPHERAINFITFKPCYNKSHPLAVTTSNDGRFKMWTVNDNQDDSKQHWSCNSMGCYRGLPAGCACFSEEGSLLAVSFESVATLWEVEGTALKTVLCHDRNKRDIKQLMFGHHTCCHYLLCHDSISLTVWNVLTLSVVWIIHTEVQVLVADPLSDNAAAFYKNQNLVIFKPDNPDPVHSFENVSETAITSAIFVSNKEVPNEEGSCFHQNSQLFFFDKDQNLFTLSEMGVDDDDETSVSEKKTVLPAAVETPFAMLQAVHKKSDVQTPECEQFNIREQEEKTLISNPLLANPTALCSAILTSLLMPLKIKEDAQKESCMMEKEKLCNKPVSISPQEIDLNDVKPLFSDFSFLQQTVTFPAPS